MIIVLDTNVIVSGLINPTGYPGVILDAVLAGTVDLAINDAIWIEYQRILSDEKFPFPPGSVTALLEYIRSYAHNVSAAPAKFKSSDQSDQAFVDVLCASDADYLVTGNLKDFKGVAKVISPKDFAVVLGEH
jgi:putative PIN family toxin of toxin-antitoxin system